MRWARHRAGKSAGKLGYQHCWCRTDSGRKQTSAGSIQGGPLAGLTSSWTWAWLPVPESEAPAPAAALPSRWHWPVRGGAGGLPCCPAASACGRLPLPLLLALRAGGLPAAGCAPQLGSALASSGGWRSPCRASSSTLQAGKQAGRGEAVPALTSAGRLLLHPPLVDLLPGDQNRCGTQHGQRSALTKPTRHRRGRWRGSKRRGRTAICRQTVARSGCRRHAPAAEGGTEGLGTQWGGSQPPAAPPAPSQPHAARRPGRWRAPHAECCLGRAAGRRAGGQERGWSVM